MNMNKFIEENAIDLLISFICIILMFIVLLPIFLKNKEQTEINNANVIHSMRVDYPEGSYRVFTIRNGDGIFVIPLDKDKQGKE